MSPFPEVARDAGRALGDCGADAESAFVEETARALAELSEEPPRREARARRGKVARREPERGPRPDGR
ncbi:MAG TPA: hypothetical protein VFL12_01840 [Thermoanaerobaculia bacterium]|nr:hypothetical protein [Thermoanaerobaculia bacterium]